MPVVSRLEYGLKGQVLLLTGVGGRLGFWLVGRAQDVHRTIEVTAGFDVNRTGGDVPFHAAAGADEHGAVAMDVAADAGVNFHFFGVDGVDELDIAAFDDVQADAVDLADDGASGAHDELAAALDIGGNDAVDMEVAALDLTGANVAHLADVNVAAGADRCGGIDVDVNVLQADGGGTVRALAVAGGTAHLEFVAAIEAFHFLEVLLADALLAHLLEGAGLWSAYDFGPFGRLTQWLWSYARTPGRLKRASRSWLGSRCFLLGRGRFG